MVISAVDTVNIHLSRGSKTAKRCQAMAILSYLFYTAWEMYCGMLAIKEIISLKNK